MKDIDTDLDYLMTGFVDVMPSSFSSGSSNSKSRNDEFIIEEEPDRRGISTQFSKTNTSPMYSSPSNNSRSSNTSSSKKASDEGDAQKKFGGAKSISSDQYFRDSANDSSVSMIQILNFIAARFVCQGISIE